MVIPAKAGAVARTFRPSHQGPFQVFIVATVRGRRLTSLAAEFGHLNLPQPERAHTASKNSRDRQRSGFSKTTQPNSRISSCQGRPAERADFGSLGGPAERRFAPSTAGKRYSATHQ